MVRRERGPSVRGLAGPVGGLIWLGALALPGCGGPGAGTVQVAPEARRQITPHVADQPKNKRLQAVAGKSFSIKDRGPAATQP
jgi:hypothetical protein